MNKIWKLHRRKLQLNQQIKKWSINKVIIKGNQVQGKGIAIY